MAVKRIRRAVSLISSVLVALSAVYGAVPASADEVNWAGRVVVPGDTVTGMDELYIGDDAYASGSGETVTQRSWTNSTPWAYMTLPVQALTQAPAPAEAVGESSTEAETAPAEQASLTAYSLQRLGMVVELEGASFPDPVNEVLMPDAELDDEDGNERTAHFVSAYFSTGDKVTVKADDAPEGMAFSEWNVIYTDPVDPEREEPLSVTNLGADEEAGKKAVLSFTMPEEEWIIRLRPSYMQAPAETEPPVQEETQAQEEVPAEELKEFVPRSVSVSCAPEGTGSAVISLDGLVPDDQSAVRAVGGQNVTVQASPADGYREASIVVMDTAGAIVAEETEGSGTLTFTMPDGDVSVNVAFDVSSGAETNASTEVSTEQAQDTQADAEPGQEGITIEDTGSPEDNAEATVQETPAETQDAVEEQEQVQAQEEAVPAVSENAQAQPEEEAQPAEQSTETAETQAPDEQNAEEPAKQAPVYKVSFDSAGGNDIMSQAVTGGGTAGEPEAPVLDGYVFGGWYADDALSVPYDFSSPVYADITLHAKWEQDENAASAETQVQEDTPASEAQPEETSAADGAETVSQEETPESVETSAPENTQEEQVDVQSTANGEAAPEQAGDSGQENVPEAVMHRVSFDSTGGSEVMSQAVEDGKNAAKPEDPARDGFAFGGWYSDAELTTAYDFSTAVTSDITLYAFWSENTQAVPEESKKADEGPADEKTAFTVTFNSMEGTEVEPQNVADGGTAGMPEDPTREGFTFAGWYSDEALTTQYAFDTPVTADITLYAKWEAVSTIKTVSFNSNGGSEVPPQSVESGSTASWPQDPVREGFSFKGWYSDEALTIAYAFTEPVTEDITLYAKWEGSTAAAHNVTVTEAQNGTVSVDKTIAATGEAVTVTATPAAGYKIKTVSVKTADGADVSLSEGVFTMPDADVTVSAEFEDDAENRQYTVTPAGSYASAITPDRTSAKAGETVTASLQNQWQKASVTWDVKDASGNDVQTAAQGDGWSVSFTMPASNVTVTAVVAISQAHTLTVNGGSGSGTYYEGDTVTIKANAPESGKDFSSWTSPSGNVTFGNAAQAETTVTMPGADASVTANYSKAMRSLTVKNGTGGGTFATGATVDISAAAPEDGKQFKAWKVTEGDVTVTDASRITTSAVIGLENSTVKATYKDSPKAEENRIEGIQDGRAYGIEQRIEFTAVGAGMDNTKPNKGDRRWLPTDYSVNTVTGKWDQPPYKTAMSIKAVGEYTVTVNFARQVYDGSQWVSDGTKDSKSIRFKISEDPDKENAQNGIATNGDGTGAGSQTSDGYNVKTGDRSPIALLAIITGSAALIAGIVLFIILKRRKK